MLQRTRIAGLVLMAGLLPAVAALASPATEGGEDIPITDPALLERLGFEPDATKVYATPQAYGELLMSPGERAARQQARLEAHRAAPEDSASSGPYGTSTSGYTSFSAAAIRPLDSRTVHGNINFGDPSRGRVCLDGLPFFEVSFDSLPHGALLTSVDVWHYDDSEEDLELTVWRACQPDEGPGDTVFTVLGSIASSGTPGLDHARAAVDDGVTLDLHSCTYFATMTLGDSDDLCSEGDLLGVQKVRAEWVRQMSPAPDMATFDDVPTTHLFYQQIEALAASGITGGCDANNFCPNEALTRAQMAAFLAKALGLHWGSF